MSADEPLTGDLFQEDKRLKLKAIKDLNQLLRDAFVNGVCSCVRCKDSSGEDNGSAFQHTFHLGGQPHHRRFTISSGSDVLSALKAAWLAYTKAELAVGEPLDLRTTHEFVEYRLYERFDLLLRASGVVKAREDGALVIQAQQDFA